MALTNQLTAIADAIRGKTGKTDPLTLDQMTTEIAGIATGGGGNANTFSGEMVIDAETNVPKEGMTFDFGLPSRVKWLFMWHSRESFTAIETPANNHIGTIIMLPVAVSDIIPIRHNATTALPDTADRFFLIGTNYLDTVSDSGYGLSSLGNMVSQNTSLWRANEDGTIMISRPSSAGIYFYPGVYHWIAVC